MQQPLEFLDEIQIMRSAMAAEQVPFLLLLFPLCNLNTLGLLLSK